MGDLRVIISDITIIMVREVRNPHLVPHLNQMLMPQPGITGITDITDMVSDITDTDILIMDMDMDITGEEDKKFEIFWKKIFFSQRQHTQKKSSNMDLIELVQQNSKFVVDVNSWQKLDK